MGSKKAGKRFTTRARRNAAGESSVGVKGCAATIATAGVDATRTRAAHRGLRVFDWRIEKRFESSFSRGFRNDRQYVAWLKARIPIRKYGFAFTADGHHEQIAWQRRIAQRMPR